MAHSDPPFPQQTGTVLVVGSAPCVFDDVSAALALRPAARILAINEAGGALRFIDFLYAGHYEKAPVFLDYRRRQQPDGNTDFTVHANWARGRTPIPEVDYWWHGCVSGATSAWTASRIAAGMGFDEIILCGCPLELSGYYNDANAIRHNCKRVGLDERTLTRYRERFLVEAERDHLPAYSMSGWTRQQLGAPS